MEISLFASDKATHAIRRTVTWEELCDSFRVPREADLPKASLPLWSPATFRDDARAAANVEQVSLLVFDVDENPVPSLGDMRTLFDGMEWFAHSSSSSRADAPRWRLLVRCARPMTGEEHGRAWRAFVERLPFRVGAASKDPSRLWYAARKGVDGSYFTSAVE